MASDDDEDFFLPTFQDHAVEQLTAPEIQVHATVNGVTTSWHDYAGRRWKTMWSPRCATCTHPLLHEINELAVLDNPASRIIKVLDLDLTVGTLNRHFRMHMPSLRGAVAGLQSALRAAGGIDGALEALTPEVVAQVVMERGFGQLMRGTMDIKASDMLAAAKLHRELAVHAGIDLDLYAEALQVVVETIRTQLDERAFDKFMWQVRSHPRMRAIMAASAGTEDVVDAQVIEAGPVEVPDRILAIL